MNSPYRSFYENKLKGITNVFTQVKLYWNDSCGAKCHQSTPPCLQSVNDAVEPGELTDLSITKSWTPERSQFHFTRLPRKNRLYLRKWFMKS